MSYFFFLCVCVYFFTQELGNQADYNMGASSIISLCTYRNQQAAILAASNSTDSIRNALNQLEWSNDQVQGLEQTLVNGPLHTFCDGDNGVSTDSVLSPQIN